ncbi:hypothetical protein B1987_18595, partial [Mycobacterium kansasii]
VAQPVAETVPKVAPALLAPLNAIAKSLSGATMRAGGLLGGQVSAAARSAGTIGQLSVPPSWATPQATVAAKTFQAATPLTTLPTSDAAPAAMPGLPGMPSAATGRAGVVPRYGLRMTVMSRPLSGG